MGGVVEGAREGTRRSSGSSSGFPVPSCWVSPPGLSLSSSLPFLAAPSLTYSLSHPWPLLDLGLADLVSSPPALPFTSWVTLGEH